MTTTADVLVVGAGPTGLTLAGDLARGGRTVHVLERRAEQSRASRAFAVMPRTLEALDARGLADDLVGTGGRAGRVELFRGAVLDLTRGETRYPFALITPQTHVDAALAAHATGHGAHVHRGVEVTGLAQDLDGVTVTTADGSTWRAAYVVAADGAHSSVRRLLDVAFPGRTVLRSVALADVRLTEGRTDGSLEVGSTGIDFGFLAPYGRTDAHGGSWYRSMTWERRHQLPDDGPVGREAVERVLAHALGRDVGVAEIGWTSRFHCDERQVRSYRHGRVFLAGDAAHVHSPVGGQGMNTGIQDAANLSWRLLAALGTPAGPTRDAVLDGYHTERHPVGRQVLRRSGAMLRAITLGPRWARAVRDAVAPRALGVRGMTDRVAGGFSGLEIRYPRRRGQSPLVGTRADVVPLVGTRLAELQRDGSFVLVHRRRDPGTALPADLPADLSPTLSGLLARARVVPAVRADDGPAVLIRPDGYVAWSG